MRGGETRFNKTTFQYKYINNSQALRRYKTRLYDRRLNGAHLSALSEAALVYSVLVYTEWIRLVGLIICGKYK